MEFETEEQQIEALKKWWKENARQVIVGAVIGVGLILGWRYYLDYSDQQSAQASLLFEQMVSESSAAAQVNETAVYEKIKTDYSATPYKAAAGLMVAKSYYISGEKDKAVSVLDDIISNDKYPVIVLVARERKARILIDQGKADEALKVLDVSSKTGFEAIYAELEGDAYVLKGNKDKARNAYDKALLLIKSGSKQLLQMKRDNLGEQAVG